MADRRKALVVATHPDDETLGCGGTLLKHADAGDQVYWLIVTDMKRGGGFREKEIRLRKKEISAVAELFGFERVFKLGFPAKRLSASSVNGLIDKIAKAIGFIKPDTIYLPFMGDVHSDHRIVFQAVYSCTKVFRYPYLRKILMMETLSETEFAPAVPETAFVPNYYVDITDYMAKKIQIMNVYKTEMGTAPFPRSEDKIRALAGFRGSAAGCGYAESFMALKDIW